MKEMSVLKAKRFGIYTCDEDDTLKAAARKMTERNISCLVVVDDSGKLRGIITRTDLVRACYQTDAWATHKVRDYMARDVVTVEVQEPLERVMELLVDKHIHRVVAVRREGGKQVPIGVMSAADIVYHMAQGVQGAVER